MNGESIQQKRFALNLTLEPRTRRRGPRTRALRLWAREIRPTVTLALPIVAGMLSHTLIGLADTIMIGRVGTIPLAAASFVNAVTHIPMVFFVGLLSSVAVLGAQAIGGRRTTEAGEVLRHGLILSAGAGVVAIASLIGVWPFLGHLGQPAAVIEAVGVYYLLFSLSMLPLLVSHGSKQFSEACHFAWVPNGILLGGVVLNVFLNWILIYGNWGAPALGLTGAGWATLLARTAAAAAMLFYVLRAPGLRRFQPVAWWAGISRDLTARLLRLGGPVGVQHLMEVSAFVFAALMMGWISAEALAAHQIAITCAATTFMFSLGLGMAVCIRVGHAWGAGQRSRMRRIGFIGIASAGTVMGLFACVFMIGSRSIAGLFTDAPALLTLTAQLLMVAAIFQVADGVQVVAISALRGLADVRIPAMIAALAYWAVAVPIGYGLAFHAGFNAIGVWAGLALGLGTAATALSWRFHHHTRRNAATQRTE